MMTDTEQYYRFVVAAEKENHLWPVIGKPAKGEDKQVAWGVTEKEALDIAYGLQAEAILRHSTNVRAFLNKAKGYFLNRVEEQIGRIVDTALEVERVIHSKSLHKLIDREVANTIAGKIIYETVQGHSFHRELSKGQLTIEDAAQAIVAIASAPKGLPHDAPAFIVEAVDEKRLFVQQGNMLLALYRAVQNEADQRYGNADLAEGDSAVLINEFFREMPWAHHADTERVKEKAASYLDWRAPHLLEKTNKAASPAGLTF
jgi:hypothetical protein